MDNRTIAIGVAVALIIVAVGGIVTLTRSNDDGGKAGVDIDGRWQLIYYETADLVDDNQMPVHDAEDCEIRSRTFDPNIEKSILEIDRVGEHVFTGKSNGNEISGTHMGPRITFRYTSEEGGHTYVRQFNGIVRSEGDGYMTASTAKYGIIGEGADARQQVCSFGYALYVPEGKAPVSPMVDYVDYHMFRDHFEHVTSLKHTVTDFEGDGKGEGTELPIGLEFVRTHSMISLFDVTDGKDSIGVQALVSLGTTPTGMAMNTVAGNVKTREGGFGCFIGYGSMADGKATFIQHVRSAGMDSPYFFELEYNVPYYDGTLPVPIFLGKYDARYSIWADGGDPETGEAVLEFRMHDRTVYCRTSGDKVGATMFGELVANVLDVTLIGKDIVGRLQGYVEDDGSVHLFGKVLGSGGATYLINYDLTPIGK